jgi:hypothetical protein
MSGEEESAMMHFQTGARILCDRANDSSGSAPGPSVGTQLVLKARSCADFDTLARTFVNIDNDLILFGMQEPFLHVHTSPAIPSAFYSLEEAQVHLDILISTANHVRGKMLHMAERDLKARGLLDNVDEDVKHCLTQAYSRTVSLDPAPGILQELEAAKQGLVSWMSALASFSVPEARETQLAHLLVQIQFFFIWCVN